MGCSPRYGSIAELRRFRRNIHATSRSPVNGRHRPQHAERSDSCRRAHGVISGLCQLTCAPARGQMQSWRVSVLRVSQKTHYQIGGDVGLENACPPPVQNLRRRNDMRMVDRLSAKALHGPTPRKASVSGLSEITGFNTPNGMTRQRLLHPPRTLYRVIPHYY